MLEGLDAIAWSQLHHAYGEASGIPDLIRKLASNDPKEWVGALSGMYDTCCHQMCSVYPATVPAVGFLVELLDYSEIKCRGKILQFLADSAFAGPEEDDEGFPDEVRETRQAIWRGLETYLGLLTDLDERIRVNVPYLLSTLVSEALNQAPDGVSAEIEKARIADRLRSHFSDEPNEFVQASLVFGLAYIGQGEPWLVAWLNEQLNSDSRQVRLAVSMAIANEVETLPSLALDCFLEELGDNGPGSKPRKLFDTGTALIEGKYHPIGRAMLEFEGELDSDQCPDADAGQREDFDFPWTNRVDFGAKFGLLKNLEKADPAEIQRIVPALFAELEQANVFNIEDILGPVLNIVFSDSLPNANSKPADLTEPQLEVLSRLFSDTVLWTTNYHHEMFGLVGLGEDRDVWAQVIGIESRPDKDEVTRMLDAVLQDKNRFSKSELCLRRVANTEILEHLIGYAELDRSEITKLDLSHSKLRDSDLDFIADFSNLKHLLLSYIPITNAGVERLLPLLGLKELYLYGSQVDDGVFPLLEKFPSLTYVHLGNSLVQEEAVANFKQAHPDCRVYH